MTSHDSLRCGKVAYFESRTLFVVLQSLLTNTTPIRFEGQRRFVRHIKKISEMNASSSDYPTWMNGFQAQVRPLKR